MLKGISLLIFLSLNIHSLYAQKYKTPPAVTIISSSAFDPIAHRDSITIFYFDTLTLFKVSKASMKSIITYSESGESNNSEMHFYQKTQFFAFKKNDDKHGFLIVNDSVIEMTKTLEDFKEETMLKWSIDTVQSSEISYTKIIDSNDIYNYIEIYSYEPNAKLDCPDSLKLYYGNKFNQIEYNLSEKNNFSKGYKLEKISVIYNLSRLLKSTTDERIKTIEYFSELSKPNLLDYEVANKFYELISYRLR